MKRGDIQKYALQVQSLIGLLKTLGPEGDIELNCGSHVARCGEGGVVQRSLQREKDSGDSGK